MPSSMKIGVTLTPPMPPALFISSISSSAAALPGTPNTEAGPDVNVLMPIFSSAGLSCAVAVPCPIASAAAIAHNVFSLIVSPRCSYGAFLRRSVIAVRQGAAIAVQCANGPRTGTFRILEAGVLPNGSVPRRVTVPSAQRFARYGLQADQASQRWTCGVRASAQTRPITSRISASVAPLR